MPIGLLLAEAYGVKFHLQNPFNDNYKIPFVFDIACAVVLLLLLPKRHIQRLRALALTPVIVFGTPVVLQYV